MKSTSNSQPPASETAFRFNPFDADFHANPYPTFHHLRATDPVHWSFLGVWILTRYVDVKAVLSDPRFQAVQIPRAVKKRSQYLQKRQKNLDALFASVEKSLFFLNPPEHNRLRRIVSKIFTATAIAHLRRHIETIAHRAIDRIQHQGHLDIIADFADPLPGQVAAKLMGLPDADYPQLHRWSSDLFRIFDPMHSLKTAEAMNQVAAEFLDYLRSQIAQQRQQPQPGLLSDLLAIQDENDRLSEAEILATCIMLFAAGEQTTSSIIGNGMLALLRHPDRLTWLRQNPDAIQIATEEIFRYDSPTQLVARVASEPVQLGSKTIQPGQNAILCLGAANRDPAEFPDPDRLNLRRNPNRHIAFAAGPHFCLGAVLARMEVPIALNALVQRLPNLTLTPDPLRWRENIVIRYLRSLPVTFDSTQL